MSIAVQRVLDLLSEVERGTCEPKKMAAQNSQTLGIIFMGVLKLILTEVEDARRLQTLPLTPRLACLIQFLSSGKLQHERGNEEWIQGKESAKKACRKCKRCEYQGK